ncbi:4-hydroxythreonine-4-phosphate dehydrogenase PdxA [Mycolicibacterium komossense]|uniref:4-hydroxythreonine-4-phosphate dehydrogenase PdxA n=1 Tax=Mycolicibacterium komossense TaxID=1779 RepID=A0ABT3CHI4_9MYCO|nr:4-hydroxythreonine-4-phosphate dehydrogenase PdxA [Mycolicibacterium komossense]MCV7228922.1 4-hydroxythreonine-4-phosphate dehydrogenase PdxA [Mycolicibacterium komossense]
MEPILIFADDLSGAAEAAAGFLGRGVSLQVQLTPVPTSADVTVIDLHNRRDSVGTRARTRAVLGAFHIAGSQRVLVKIDSLLRGNIATTLESLTHTGRPIVLAAGNPVLNRTIVGGAPFVGGVPLHETNLWHAETLSAPRHLAEVIGDVRDIRICDVTSDADLDAVVAEAEPDAILVGTGALTAAVARSLPVGSRQSGVPTGSRAVFVVGTADSAAHHQLAALAAAGIPIHSLDSDDLLDGTAAVEVPTESIALAITGPVRPADAHRLVAALADTAVGLVDDATDLVLTGGETARAVLDRLGVHALEPIHEIHTGAIMSVTPAGSRVVTRPGSFGGRESLTTILRHLQPSQLRSRHSEAQPMSENLPYVALTMGDGAGIGPEVIVPALLDPQVASWCRPVVIGDAARLRRAAGVLGLAPEIGSVEHISDAVFVPGRINVIDLNLLPEDLAWGELSAVAGHAAYEYIRVASELAVNGQVQAICTAPLNKEALHAAGHIFPGHTELLAHLTGIEEVSMMLSTPKLKVIHVTTHIGLLDAVAKIEPGLVERTIRRGNDALVRSGNAHPKIGVCGINPHAGENGLFGYGEEDQKIVPALEVLRADGIDVHGPLPADTAFFLAGRGDYDLIVAMYHDQGHGPVKVLGIEAGVNITVGLPVIRTSVDHGTAFDIAGKGIAEPGSMVEALRQAAELATSTAVVN